MIDLDGLIAWLQSNWQVVALIGGGVVAIIAVLWILLVVAAKRREREGLDFDPEFPHDGEQARDLAIGLITLVDNFGIWNDPDAKPIARSESTKKHLRSQWGIADHDDWMQNIKRLVTEKRRSEPRDTLLAIRVELAGRLGRRPGHREWLDEVKDQGGSARGENRDVISAIGNIEERMTKYRRGAVLPAGTVIRDAGAFAYSQAVALAVWGVALGVATREQALEVAQAVSARARQEYGSWEEFGRSVLLGRAMFLGGDDYDSDKFDDIMSGALNDYVFATNPGSRRPGPWTYLPW